MFYLHRKYQPLKVGYEKYGKDSDIAHMNIMMTYENYHFDIIALGGRTKKEDRIRGLIPLFQDGHFFIPPFLYFQEPRLDLTTNLEEDGSKLFTGKQHDFIQEFRDEEYTWFPVAQHDDMLDCMARILDDDLNALFPDPTEHLDDWHNVPRDDHYKMFGHVESNKEYDPLNYMNAGR